MTNPNRVTYDDLTPAQQIQAMADYRKDTGGVSLDLGDDRDEVVVTAVFYGFDWDRRTGRPWQ